MLFANGVAHTGYSIAFAGAGRRSLADCREWRLAPVEAMRAFAGEV